MDPEESTESTVFLNFFHSFPGANSGVLSRGLLTGPSRSSISPTGKNPFFFGGDFFGELGEVFIYLGLAQKVKLCKKFLVIFPKISQYLSIFEPPGYRRHAGDALPGRGQGT